MWPFYSEPSELHEAEIAEKRNALRDLNAALQQSDIDIRIENNERWLPFFTKLFRILTVIIIRQHMQPGKSFKNDIWPT